MPKNLFIFPQEFGLIRKDTVVWALNRDILPGSANIRLEKKDKYAIWINMQGFLSI